MTKNKNVSHEKMREALFCQIQLLSDPDLTKDEAQRKELLQVSEQIIGLTKAMIEIDKEEVEETKNKLEFAKLMCEYGCKIDGSGVKFIGRGDLELDENS